MKPIARKSKYCARITEKVPFHMEDIVETITWPETDYDYVRGHIFSNPWGSKRWVAVVFGYDDNPPDSQAFRYLPEARRWAFSVLRKRNRQRRERAAITAGSAAAPRPGSD